MTFFKKLRFAWHAFWWGMKNADSKMLEQKNGGEGVQDEDTIEQAGSLWQDLINKEETQRVQEFRDEQYRVVQESSEYHIDKQALTYDNEGNVLPDSVKIEKRDTSEPITRDIAGIYKESSDSIVLEQLNNKIMKASYETGTDNYGEKESRILTIERDFIPKFKIENYTKKIVVRKNDNLASNKVLVDFYVSKYPEELNVIGEGLKAKIDKSSAFFIKEVENILKNGIGKSDILSFNDLSFVTNKAFNKKDLLLFTYGIPIFKNCIEYDGNYILSVEMAVLNNGYDLTEKYRTESVDKKYRNKEQKTDTFNVNEMTTDLVYGEEK